MSIVINTPLGPKITVTPAKSSYVSIAPSPASSVSKITISPISTNRISIQVTRTEPANININPVSRDIIVLNPPAKPTITISSVGVQGPPGPPGVAGRDGSNGTNGIDSLGFYEHNQSMPSNLWVVTHNLNRRPSVTVTDTAGQMWIGDVEHQSLQQLTIGFGSAFAGRAYLI